jgi:hypothetical protein
MPLKWARYHDTYTKFHKDWFMYSKVGRGETQTHRQQDDLVCLLLFFQNKESRLKTVTWTRIYACNSKINIFSELALHEEHLL